MSEDRRAGIPEYAELRALSNFSFLKGASWPEELVERAKKLGYSALAVCDECSMAGAVRAHVEGKEQGLKVIHGSQFTVVCDAPFTFVVLACNLEGYGNLCQFITALRRTAEKGTYRLVLDAIEAAALADCVVLVSPDRESTDAQLEAIAHWLLSNFTGRCWLAVEMQRVLDDEMWLHRMEKVSELTAIPLVASGDVRLHIRSRKPLHDVMTATRVGRPLTDCGLDLELNSEQHMRTRVQLAQRFSTALLAETLNVAARCTFSLDELRYQYPSEVVPDGQTPSSYLRQLAYEGAGRRWPDGIPPKVQTQIEHELELIADLAYEHYFLTVADIVRFAQSQGILCQG
ncbi:MAG TPA: PHP domain-containing protein, partial [Pseudorhodoferax sp.]|nr:PHP domain-containing protein [Pseudorhodoferax sp.]